jgi:hypothetical protein
VLAAAVVARHLWALLVLVALVGAVRAVLTQSMAQRALRIPVAAVAAVQTTIRGTTAVVLVALAW